VVPAQSSDENLSEDFVKGDLNDVELGLLMANPGGSTLRLADPS
jgi:hypothetical protein